MSIDDNLRKFGLILPEPASPAGRYKPFATAGDLLFVSGQFPFLNDGALAFEGRIGLELSFEDGFKAAEIAALNVLAQIKNATHDFESFGQLLRVEGHVAAADGFLDQTRILDGASQLFANVLGHRAGHARSAFCYGRLPLNAPVELVVTASLRRDKAEL